MKLALQWLGVAILIAVVIALNVAYVQWLRS